MRTQRTPQKQPRKDELDGSTLRSSGNKQEDMATGPPTAPSNRSTIVRNPRANCSELPPSYLHSTKYVFARALSLVPILTQIFFKEIDFYMIIQPRE